MYTFVASIELRHPVHTCILKFEENLFRGRTDLKKKRTCHLYRREENVEKHTL